MNTDTTKARSGGYLATIGLAGGLGAVVASSCCVLPLVFAGLGAGAGVFGALEALASIRLPLLALSGLAIAAAWFMYLRRRRACAADASCASAPPARTTAVVLSLATLLLATAAAWDVIEPVALRMMRRGL